MREPVRTCDGIQYWEYSNNVGKFGKRTCNFHDSTYKTTNAAKRAKTEKMIASLTTLLAILVNRSRRASIVGM